MQKSRNITGRNRSPIFLICGANDVVEHNGKRRSKIRKISGMNPSRQIFFCFPVIMLLYQNIYYIKETKKVESKMK
jgi:hypothetical protein